MSAVTFNEAWERAHGYAWGIWDSTGKLTLRNILVELKESHDREVAAARDAFPLDLPTYDAAGNERHKAACDLREWHPDILAHFACETETQIKILYQILTGKAGGDVKPSEAATAVRDRLIELLES